MSEQNEKLRLVLEYRPDQKAQFVRLYDKAYFQMQGPWLYPPNLVTGKSPDQLREFFKLPFLPEYICDVIVQPENTILAYATSESKSPNVFYGKTGLSFFNERKI